ncbi:MAG: hypothetical protein NC833_04615, partial [Candidatus Omnitrophica bacterium]|nr:hypothetical protein [Candidatus Omnitrophota bacterium]
MEDEIFLLIFEADRIQEYIFKTGKLIENIGGSVLIDQFNKKEVYEVIHAISTKGNITVENGNYILNDNSIKNGLDYEVLYSGGGNVKLLAKREDIANKISDALLKKYRELTVSADATCIFFSFDPNSEPLEKVLEKGEKEIRAKKLGKDYKIQPFSLPYFKICQSCGTEPAINYQDEEYLGESCFKKREKGRKSDIFQDFKDEFKKNLFGNNFQTEDIFPKEIDKITDEKHGNFIGIVVIDGNKFGEKIKNLLKQHKNLNFSEKCKILRNFSKTIDKLAKECLAEASIEVLNEKKITKPPFPFRPIVIGGDDLCFVSRGDLSIHIAKKFAEKLN